MPARILYWAALSLYVISLFLPGFVTDHAEDPTWLGYQILELGWAGMLQGQFAWCANALLVAALVAIQLKLYGTGAIFSGVAFVLGLQSLLFSEYPLDEAGAKTAHVDHLASGFHVWELSLLLLLAYCLTVMAGARRST